MDKLRLLKLASGCDIPAHIDALTKLRTEAHRAGAVRTDAVTPLWGSEKPPTAGEDDHQPSFIAYDVSSQDLCHPRLDSSSYGPLVPNHIHAPRGLRLACGSHSGPDTQDKKIDSLEAPFFVSLCSSLASMRPLSLQGADPDRAPANANNPPLSLQVLATDESGPSESTSPYASTWRGDRRRVVILQVHASSPEIVTRGSTYGQPRSFDTPYKGIDLPVWVVYWRSRGRMGFLRPRFFLGPDPERTKRILHPSVEMNNLRPRVPPDAPSKKASRSTSTSQKATQAMGNDKGQSKTPAPVNPLAFESSPLTPLSLSTTTPLQMAGELKELLHSTRSRFLGNEDAPRPTMQLPLATKKGKEMYRKPTVEEIENEDVLSPPFRNCNPPSSPSTMRLGFTSANSNRMAPVNETYGQSTPFVSALDSGCLVNFIPLAEEEQSEGGEPTVPHLGGDDSVSTALLCRPAQGTDEDYPKFFDGPGRAIDLFREPLCAAIECFYIPFDPSDSSQEDPLIFFGAVDGELSGRDSTETNMLRDAIIRYQHQPRNFLWERLSDAVQLVARIDANSTKLNLTVDPASDECYYCLNLHELALVAHVVVAVQQILEALTIFLGRRPSTSFIVDPKFGFLYMLEKCKSRTDLRFTLSTLQLRITRADHHIRSYLRRTREILTGQLPDDSISTVDSTISEIRAAYGMVSPTHELYRMVARHDYGQRVAGEMIESLTMGENFPKKPYKPSPRSQDAIPTIREPKISGAQHLSLPQTTPHKACNKSRGPPPYKGLESGDVSTMEDISTLVDISTAVLA
ncbi:hypothetical protein GGX14DRAFT_579529 [Mycena pura]|uniref:Uncharacterized protein n=1 Tax=Mycena pura TaxID=153505 RepID=A0AAD6Y219_9AGAR|nr:hypothetical protein GGX14DRAFT_579529 [Mycena pura]